MSEKKEICDHPIDHRSYGYGFAASLGFRGLGGYEYCELCYKRFSFEDDPQTNTPEEIEYNKQQRLKVFGPTENNQGFNSDVE